MKPDEEKRIPEAPKSDETLPEGALEGVAGGRNLTPRYGPPVARVTRGERIREA